MEVIRWAAVKNKLELLPLGRGDQTADEGEETDQVECDVENHDSGENECNGESENDDGNKVEEQQGM